MKILINYATPEFAHRRRIQTATAYAVGGFDKVIEYSPEDLDEEFRRKNEQILKHKRGGGYWLWKPYIIKKTLAEMGGGGGGGGLPVLRRRRQPVCGPYRTVH